MVMCEVYLVVQFDLMVLYLAKWTVSYLRAQAPPHSHEPYSGVPLRTFQHKPLFQIHPELPNSKPHLTVMNK
jgi:hypothetical protein